MNTEEITVTVTLNSDMVKDAPVWAAFLAGAEAAEKVRELVMKRSTEYE